MAKFKDGDVVQLNSGGPKMTVESSFRSDGVDFARCVWFEKSEYNMKEFPDVTLKVYEEPKLFF